MNYSISQIADLINARRYGDHHDSIILHLQHDSRSLSIPESTLFFAFKTARDNGHRYIDSLYHKGVNNFVVEELPTDFSSRFPRASFLLVENTLEALQRIAAYHRQRFHIPVVGITGSNGKTICKEWLYQILSPRYNVTRSPRSYNSQIGVPLSICRIDEQTEIALIEAGISEQGEMERLEHMITPTIGLFTHLGGAHQEHFSSMVEKCNEKLLLFKDVDLLIYNADDSVIASCLREKTIKGKRLGWSTIDPHAAIYISKMEKKEDYTLLSIFYNDKEYSFSLPYTDAASIEDVIHCIAIGFALLLPYEELSKSIQRLSPIAMRLELKEGNKGCTLINDSYNADLDSLSIALDFMHRRPLQESHTRTLILSNIEQSGWPTEKLYGHVADMLHTHHIDCLIGVGKDISASEDKFEVTQKYFFETTDSLISSGILLQLQQSLILLKGARHYHFEDIDELLAKQIHETILDINLNAITANLNYYRSFMQRETKLTCMVKADAYGSGSVDVAGKLQERGVDYLAVAVADEGATLRKAGITTNIIIMNPEMSSFNLLFRYHLQPEVYSFRLLNALIAYLEHHGITNFPIHIKIDTGMHRLGFNPDKDIPQLINILQSTHAVVPSSVFSHFVGSDSSEFDDFTVQQFNTFDKASRALQSAFPHRILRHICNSAGIERFPQYHLDMCRLGLGLYGIDPVDNRSIENVSTLRTTILQIREIPTGDTIGYSRRTKVNRDSRIAAIPIGYADGLNRKLGNGKGYCLVNGEKAFYMGNICMDVSMIDVTDIDCKEGDDVEIFGDHLPIQTISDALDTIPYEVLTSVSQRVKRIYTQE